MVLPGCVPPGFSITAKAETPSIQFQSPPQQNATAGFAIGDLTEVGTYPAPPKDRHPGEGLWWDATPGYGVSAVKYLSPVFRSFSRS